MCVCVSACVQMYFGLSTVVQTSATACSLKALMALFENNSVLMVPFVSNETKTN